MAHWIVRRRTLLAPSAGAIREVQRSVSYARAVVLDEARAHETFWSVQSLPSLCDTLLDQRFGHALENIRISDVRVRSGPAQPRAGERLQCLALCRSESNIIETRFLPFSDEGVPSQDHVLARVFFRFEALAKATEDVLIRRFTYGRSPPAKKTR